ncbi:hypothetical protein BT63DRAFT_27858 [Microthyrium microscopicum]|uniref:C3H1-type domain-containing protein n=1 Tax=Microthyrium microscopicum TaxID=703497 RepID=A0A6A6UTD4_9PEZI|nr:hypothetical protein BT63DRAFT_27858 [Microthyrium microscopicum]
MLKRGGNEIKRHVKSIIDMAAANTEKSVSNGTPKPNSLDSDGDSSMKNSPNGKSNSSSLAKMTSKSADTQNNGSSLKRPLPSDSNSSRPSTVKRLAIGNSASLASATAKRPASALGSKSSANASTGAIGQTKAKVPTGASKSMSNILAGMKKSVQSSAGGASLPSRSSSANASPQPAFSFGGMMEGILNPKAEETEKKKPEAARPKETEEQKTKRLRKEARRKLRVSWKSDDELVAVKYFTHDPDEDAGHTESSMRDVGDVGNEGRMFKQLHKDHMEIVDTEMEIDEEEREETFGEYTGPSSVDFSDIGTEQNRNYSRYGGKLEPESQERKIQVTREENSLLAVYLERSDIPSRPNSPVEATSTLDKYGPIDFGPIEDKTRHKLERLGVLSTAVPSILPATTAPVNIAEVLKMFGSGTPQPMAQPLQPQPISAQALPVTSAVPDFVSILNTLTAQPTAQNAAVPAAYSMGQPVDTSNPLAALLGALAPAPVAPVPPAPAAPLDISSFLAQIRGQAPIQAPAPVSTPPVVQPALSVQDILAGLGAAPSQAAAFNAYATPQLNTAQPGPYENPERKRFREVSADEEDDEPWNKRQNNAAGRGRGGKWSQGRGGFGGAPADSKKFTQACRFWPMGKCTKGSSCTYRHEN